MSPPRRRRRPGRRSTAGRGPARLDPAQQRLKAGGEALVAIAVYRPPSATVAGALVVAAGLYELTPLKRECRRRCRERVRSGARFGVYCLGSSLGLMVVLIALDPMSVPLMCGIAAVVLAQKLLAPAPAVDAPLALLIVGLGIAVAVT